MSVTLITKSNTSATATTNAPGNGVLAKGELAIAFSTDSANTKLYVGTGGGANAPILIAGGSNVIPTKAELGGLAYADSVDLSTGEVTNTLPISKGGTGVTSFTANAILIGNSTSSLVSSGLTITNNRLNINQEGIAFGKYTTDPTSNFGTGTVFLSNTNLLKYSPDGSNLRTLAITDNTFTEIQGITPETGKTGLVVSANNGLTVTANNTSKTLAFTTNGTNQANANTLVLRDANGSFSANVVTASLSGNANTASKWANSRNISLKGDVTGSVLSVDGSTNITISNMSMNTAYVSSLSVNTSHFSTTPSIEGTGTSHVLALASDVTIPRDLSVTRNLSVTGNLTVLGTTTTVNTTNIEVKDALITLQSGLNTTNANDIGFIFERGTSGNNAVFIWDESVDNFTLGTTTATGANTGNITVTKGVLNANVDWSNLTNIPVSANANGTVTSVGGNGTVNGITLTGTVETSGNLTLGGTLSISNADWSGTDLSIENGGTGASNATAARSNLGLAIGTNVQAYDAGLTSIAGLTTAANQMIYTTASDVYDTTSLTSFARGLLDDTDAATARTTLGLGNVENVKLSTWAGSSNITTVGTVTSGTIDGGTY